MPPRITLLATGGPPAGSMWQADDVLTVGRSQSMDVHLSADVISRRHAEIRRTPAGWFVTDISNNNGTDLNGRRLASDPELLAAGDRILIAQAVELRVASVNGTRGDLLEAFGRAESPAERGAVVAALHLTDRKARLFALAAHEIGGPDRFGMPTALMPFRLAEAAETAGAVALARSYADGEADRDALRRTFMRVGRFRNGAMAVALSAEATAFFSGGTPVATLEADDLSDTLPFLVPWLGGHVAALRDLVPPDEFAGIDPAWLTRNDGFAGHIAADVYASGRFAELPVLADALEDAGCEDEAILGHCRGPGPHFRGCWVLDAILGRG